MAEETVVFKGKLKHSGIFEFKELYKFSYTLLKEAKTYLLTEKTYSEKITKGGKEIEIEWECTKNISDYFRFIMVVKFKITNLVDVEVKKESEKVTSNKGDIEINVEGKVIRDYENKWTTSAFTKFMRSVYDRYIVKNKVEEMHEKLFADCDDLLGQIKGFLSLEARR